MHCCPVIVFFLKKLKNILKLLNENREWKSLKRADVFPVIFLVGCFLRWNIVAGPQGRSYPLTH